jgi:hypothetical protein
MDGARLKRLGSAGVLLQAANRSNEKRMAFIVHLVEHSACHAWVNT